MSTNVNDTGAPRLQDAYTPDAAVKTPTSSKSSKTRPFVYLLSGLSAIGGFLFGYDTGVVSGAMLLIRIEFRLRNDPVWQELIVSMTIAAAWVFSLVGGYLVDAIGRKPVILFASFVFAAGAVIMGASDSKEFLLFGRLVVGVGIGLASMSVPMYLAEMSSPEIRGTVVTINQVFITGGQCVASIVCGLFISDEKNGWRYMLGLSGVPAVFQLFGFLAMPESPRYLVKKGQQVRAAAVLRTIRGDDVDVDAEIEAIRQSCEKAENEVQGRSVLLEILRTPTVRRALVVGCALQMFQQLTGINTVMYYSATIFQMAGVNSISLAVWLAAATAAVNFVSSVIGLYLMEKVSRRPLTLFSLAGTIISLIVLAIGFQLSSMNSPATTFSEQSPFARNDTCAAYRSCEHCTDDTNCGFCYETTTPANSNFFGSCISVRDVIDVDSSSYGRCSNASRSGAGHAIWSHGYCPTETVYKSLLIFGMCIYLLFFELGIGPMPWTVNSEIYPLWARGTCYAIATSFNWLFNLITAMTFLSLTDAITKYGVFYLYAGITLAGLVFFFVAQRESRGKSLEELEDLYSRPLCCGGIVRRGQAIVPISFTDRTIQKINLDEVNGTGTKYGGISSTPIQP